MTFDTFRIIWLHAQILAALDCRLQVQPHPYWLSSITFNISTKSSPMQSAKYRKQSIGNFSFCTSIDYLPCACAIFQRHDLLTFSHKLIPFEWTQFLTRKIFDHELSLPGNFKSNAAILLYISHKKLKLFIYRIYSQIPLFMHITNFIFYYNLFLLKSHQVTLYPQF